LLLFNSITAIESTNFIIDPIGTATSGKQIESTSFENIIAAEQEAIGETSSTNFKVEIGYLYAIYSDGTPPTIISVSPSVSHSTEETNPTFVAVVEDLHAGLLYCNVKIYKNGSLISDENVLPDHGYYGRCSQSVSLENDYDYAYAEWVAVDTVFNQSDPTESEEFILSSGAPAVVVGGGYGQAGSGCNTSLQCLNGLYCFNYFCAQKTVYIERDLNLTDEVDINLSEGVITLFDSNICGGVPINDGSDRLILHFNESIDGANGESGTLTTGNLKLIMHFGEGTGNPTDDSGNSNTFTNNGADWNADGRYGSALTFVSANTDNLARATDADFDVGANTAFTAGFWIRTPDREVSSEETIWGKMNNGGDFQGWEIMLRTNDTIGIRIREVTTTTANLEVGTIDVTDGDWHLIVAGRDATGILYLSIDGGAYTTDASPLVAGSLANTNFILMGVNQTVAAEYFDGDIDEPFFFDGLLLDQNEVAMLYNHRWKGQTFMHTAKMDAGYWAADGGSLSYDTISNFDESSAYIGLWTYNSWDGDDGVWHTFLDMETTNNVNQLEIMKLSTGNALRVDIEDVASGVRTLSFPVDKDSFPKNTWHHIAVTLNQSDLDRLYLNGVAVDASVSGTGTGKITQRPSTVYIGRDATTQANEAKAIIDEVVIRNRPLTPQEVYCEYLSGKNNHQTVLGEGS